MFLLVLFGFFVYPVVGAAVTRVLPQQAWCSFHLSWPLLFRFLVVSLPHHIFVWLWALVSLWGWVGPSGWVLCFLSSVSRPVVTVVQSQLDLRHVLCSTCTTEMVAGKIGVFARRENLTFPVHTMRWWTEFPTFFFPTPSSSVPLPVIFLFFFLVSVVTALSALWVFGAVAELEEWFLFFVGD